MNCACEVGARAQKDTHSVPPLVMARAKGAGNGAGRVAFQGLVRRQTSSDPGWSGSVSRNGQDQEKKIGDPWRENRLRTFGLV